MNSMSHVYVTHALNLTDESASSESILSYIVMGYLIFVAVFGTISNTISILVFSSKKPTIRNALVVNLAVADLSSPVLTYWMVISSSFYQEWQYGQAGCQIYAFINCLVGMAGIANLTTLALERYVTLVGSDRQKELLKKTQVFLIITVWLYAFLVSVPPLLGWGRFAQDTFVASCSFDFYSNDMNAQSYFMFLLTVGFFVPLTISGLYIAIYRKIQKYRKHFESAQLDNQIVTQKRRCLSVPWDIEVFNDKATDVNSCWVSNDKPRCISSDEIPLSCQAENDLNTHKFDNESIPMSRRLALAEVKFAEQTFFMILGYVVCWAPYAILTIMCHIGVIACYNPIASAVSLMLAKGSVAINPVIYAFSGKKSEEA